MLLLTIIGFLLLGAMTALGLEIRAIRRELDILGFIEKLSEQDLHMLKLIGQILKHVGLGELVDADIELKGLEITKQDSKY
jgi:hypothetical protein